MGKKLKYWLSLGGLIVLILAAFAVIYLLIMGPADYQRLLLDNLVIVAVAAVVWFIAFKFLTEYMEKAKFDAQSDAFGLTNDLSYTKMSDKERKEYDKRRKEEMDRVLSEATIRKATHKGSKHPEDEMGQMSGMEDVKEKVQEIAARAEYDKKHAKKGEAFSSHYVFYGAPGTGKTTFARILTGMFYQKKIIRQNLCIEVDGNLLKANAPGEGALKAEILVKKACSLGCVLFIDEAYSMAQCGGNEAVDTLIKLMEDMRGQFILILAGYTGPMQQLLSSNPGFRSRIKDYLEFPDYTVDEAEGIFRSLAKKEGFKLTKGAIANFHERYEAEMQSKDFGNARTVRNVFDEAISSYAVRISRDKTTKRNVLTSKDVHVSPRRTI